MFFGDFRFQYIMPYGACQDSLVNFIRSTLFLFDLTKKQSKRNARFLRITKTKTVSDMTSCMPRNMQKGRENSRPFSYFYYILTLPFRIGESGL